MPRDDSPMRSAVLKLGNNFRWLLFWRYEIVIAGSASLQLEQMRFEELPPDVDIETAKLTYANGILEVTFKKKAKPKGKEIKID